MINPMHSVIQKQFGPFSLVLGDIPPLLRGRTRYIEGHAGIINVPVNEQLVQETPF